MGAGAVSPGAEKEEPEDEHGNNNREWKVMLSLEEAKTRYILDGTLTASSNRDHVTFRSMLDDTYAQNALGKFARERQTLEIFMFWIDVQEFKMTNATGIQRSKAKYIYSTYIEDNADSQIGEVAVTEKKTLGDTIAMSVSDPSLLDALMFESIQSRVFLSMYNNIFMHFKQTKDFDSLIKRLAQKYNQVTIDDFEYYRKLGEGGFGFVVHCKKKTTGRHYAMKMQTKKGILECYRGNTSMVCAEKEAFAKCQHPFIVNLDYAFQTENLAIMVLGLGIGGDLNKAIMNAPDCKLNLGRVQFYAAETVLALSYMHQMGLIYRDLKPQNILLGEDGHIQLVDLGGVADATGDNFNTKTKKDPAEVAALFRDSDTNETTLDISRNYEAKSPKAASTPKGTPKSADTTKADKQKKEMGIVGTIGYMAPEMVLMIFQKSHEAEGYTYMVDWWSLGVTMYKMITGKKPFSQYNYESFVDFATQFNEKILEFTEHTELMMILQKTDFSDPAFTPESIDLISKLLNVDELKRLGSEAVGGLAAIKSHPFFAGIDWDMLEQKHVDPPFIPDFAERFHNLVPYPNLGTLLVHYNKLGEWDVTNTQTIKPTRQQYFSEWDFVSQTTIRIECGLAREMEQYAANNKLKKILG